MSVRVTFLLLTILQRLCTALHPCNYVAIGSNLLPSVMKDLRNIDIAQVKAYPVYVPDFQLSFSLGGAAVAVQGPEDLPSIHGVLYELNEEDFSRVGLTEGVPWSYQWSPCTALKYETGEEIPAFILTSKAATPEDSSEEFTSLRYLRILQEGAEFWDLDPSYQRHLFRNVKTRGNPVR